MSVVGEKTVQSGPHYRLAALRPDWDLTTASSRVRVLQELGLRTMSRAKLAGILVLGIGAVLGFLVGGAIGLGIGSVFLVIGLTLLFYPEASGVAGPHAALKPRLLVLLKEVHTRPQKNGKLQEIENPNQAGLEFEIFASCWFLNESEAPVRVVDDLQLSLQTSDGSVRTAERIRGDLEQWRLGSLVRDEWDTDVVRAHQQAMREVSMTEPLACGVPRHGWAHFRFTDVSPADMNKGELRLSVQDAASNTFIGVAKGPTRYLPGRVWPFFAKGASAASSALSS